MGRYISADQITAMFPQVVATAGSEPGDLEFHIEVAEDEIDGRLGRYWNMTTFSGNAPPMVRTLARLRGCHNYLHTLITMENPSQSTWVTNLGDRFDKLMENLETGKNVLVSGSGTVIGMTPLGSDKVYSSTVGYAPTMTILDPIEQQMSRTRQQDVEDEQIADNG